MKTLIATVLTAVIAIFFICGIALTLLGSGNLHFLIQGDPFTSIHIEVLHEN